MIGTPHRLAPTALAALLLLAACTPAGSPAPAAPATTAPLPAGAASAPSSAPATSLPAAVSPTHVRMASQKVATDIAIYLADEKGYFRQEGIELEFVNFANASEMIPALATDQLDVAPVAANPAAFNAIARGVGMRLVLDKGTFKPGHSDQALVMRKDVYDSGRGQRLDDLRGLSIAITPPGKATSTACALQSALARVGQSLDDLNIQPLPFPDQVGALANGSIDGAIMAEPFQSRALKQGAGVKVLGIDEMYPGFMISAVGFSTPFYANRAAAKGYVRAYIRATRDYLAAIYGRAPASERQLVDEVIARFTGIDLAVVRDMAPPGFSANGLPNVESMLYCYEFFRAQNLIPQPVPAETFATLWGIELVEEVLAELGRQPES